MRQIVPGCFCLIRTASLIPLIPLIPLFPYA